MASREAEARFAARDAASLAGLNIEAVAEADKVDAMSRIISDLGTPILQAKYVFARLVRQLQNADLTINFVAYKFFNRKPSGEKYVSQFEGGNTWGDPTYMQTRDDAEEAMFDYSASRAAPNVPGAQAVQQRVQQVGQRGSAEFEGAIRPKYAALNYANLKYGSAGQWGKSYMILKEYIKHGATYVHTDSFDCAGSARQRQQLAGQVANFINMQKLIANMPAAMLRALNQASQGHDFGLATQVPGLGSTAYVEAHCHSDIRFERDIATMVINRDEMAECEQRTRTLREKDPKRWRVITSKKLKATFEKFATTYGIDIDYN